MPCIRVKVGRYAAILSVPGEYKPGDLPPEGYTEWHEWADVQRKAGIKQVQCGSCGLWNTPQELSETRRTWSAKRRDGREIKFESRICLKCAASHSQYSSEEKP